MKILPVVLLQDPCLIRKKVKQGEEGHAKTAWWSELKREEGSFTVEASILVPLFCFILFGVMMVSLYLCDQNLTQSFLKERASELSRDEKSYSAKDMERDRDYLEEQLFIARVEEFNLRKSAKKIKGEITISMELSLPILSQWIGELWRNPFVVNMDVGNCGSR